MFGWRAFFRMAISFLILSSWLVFLPRRLRFE